VPSCAADPCTDLGSRRAKLESVSDALITDSTAEGGTAIMNDANIAHLKGGAKAILQYGADVLTLDVDVPVDLLQKTRAIADDGGTG
jgi:hypothetical protein